MRRRRTASTLAVLVALPALGTGCAPGGYQSAIPGTTPVHVSSIAHASTRLDPEARAPRHTITRSELDRSFATTAFELVQRVRPEFLKVSYRVPVGSHAEPVVYVDAARSGALSTLRLVPAAEVVDITYVSPVDALLRYGPTHGAGAILVRTRH